jgi:glycosyltransferase involved in cell wall biosynthesis
MKIAVIAPTEIPARRANTVQVMKMAAVMAALGHEVRLASPAENQAQPVPWDDLARHYGLRSEFSVTWLKALPRLRRYDYAWRAVQWAISWKADLVYTRLPQAAVLACSRGVATILELHDLPQGKTGPWLFRRFIHSSQARRMVAITRALAQDLVGLAGGESSLPAGLLTIAPDGVDLERYQDLPRPAEARRKLGIGLPERFTAGYTGHLYAGRGTEILLGIAGQLPEINLLLVGGEPAEVTRLEEEARAAGLGNVTCAGFVPNAELPLYQAACDVLLMPYQQRVAASSGGDIARYLSPMKLFEYMACGRAILSSDLPVLREVLNPGNAVLLLPGDLDGWVVGLRDLAADPLACRGLGEQARRDVAAYTWEERAGKILEGIP